MKLVRVVQYALRRYFADRCPRDAASIAYRVLFSIGPLAIVIVSVFGLVLQDEGVRQDAVDAVVDALPASAAGRRDVEDALTTIASNDNVSSLDSDAPQWWPKSATSTPRSRCSSRGRP